MVERKGAGWAEKSVINNPPGAQWFELFTERSSAWTEMAVREARDVTVGFDWDAHEHVRFQSHC